MVIRSLTWGSFSKKANNMEVKFISAELEGLYRGVEDKWTRKYGQAVVKAFVKKVEILAICRNTVELATQWKSLHFEPLTKEKRYKGFHSVRVNDKYRIILKIIKEKGGKETIEIVVIHDLTDYH